MRKITPKQDEFAVSGHGGLKKGKSEPIYPRVSMDLQHLPEAKDMKLGDKAHIGMHVKLVGLNQSRFNNSAEFEVHGIEHKKIRKGQIESENETPADSETGGK